MSICPKLVWVALALMPVSACRKENHPRKSTSLANKSLAEVQSAISGKWRGLYTYFSGFIYNQQEYKDSSLGYYTYFFSDRVVFKNKAGDSSVEKISWSKVSDGPDSYYAFSEDANPSLFGSFAPTEIRNDSLFIDNLVHGEGASGALYKRP